MMITQVSLNKFLFDCLKPYKWYVVALLLIAIYQGLDNTVSPYVLKLIIDKAVAVNNDKSAVFNSLKPYVMLYITLWFLIAMNMRIFDWVRLKLFPSIRYDIVTSMFDYLNKHSHRYFQNNFAGSLSNKISDMQSAAVAVFSTLDDASAILIRLFIAIITMLFVQPIFCIDFVGMGASIYFNSHLFF